MKWRVLILWGVMLAAALVVAGDGLLELAQRQFETGNYADAIQALQTALAQNGQDARVHFWLARCFYELRDFDQAVAFAERAVRADPRNSDYHLWLGKAYGRKADRQRSLSLARKTKREFEEAVRLNPANIPARRALGDYLSQAPWIAGGSDSKAREQAEVIAALDPVEGHLARADYWLNETKPERAEAEYRRVLELKPERVEPYLEVARFYRQRNARARVEEAVEAAARVNPGDGRLSFYRGVARVMAGNRLSEAEQFLKSYLATVPQREDFPSHTSAREWLGRLYERLGKREQAAREYRAALQLDPDRKSAREALRRLEKP